MIASPTISDSAFPKAGVVQRACGDSPSVVKADSCRLNKLASSHHPRVRGIGLALAKVELRAKRKNSIDSIRMLLCKVSRVNPRFLINHPHHGHLPSHTPRCSQVHQGKAQGAATCTMEGRLKDGGQTAETGRTLRRPIAGIQHCQTWIIVRFC